jgi:periplasmic divalent cation tolerance protein
MNDASEYVVAITTLATEEEAVSLARSVVERRLVACANVLSGMRSLYRWQGAIQEEREHLVLLKTRADRFDDLAKAFDELHPYDVPELIALPVARGTDAYLGWIRDSLVGDARDRSE